MATLSQLPNEILTQILSFLRCSDLAGTSLVCHHFRSASLPLLYKVPCISQNHKPESTQSSVELFLATIVAPGNERLGKLVRHLHLHWTTISDLFGPSVKSPGALVRRGDQQRYISFAIEQLNQFRILLDHVPYLEVLYLNHLPLTRRRLYNPPRRANPAQVLESRPLREFHLVDGNGEGLSPDSLFGLFRLPNIELITTRIINTGNCPPDAVLTPTESSCVRKLHLADSYVAPEKISRFLAVASALTHFSYVSDKAWAEAFDPARFMASLAPLKGTLHHLHLDLQQMKQTAYFGLSSFQGDSFRDWSALRTLCCPLVLLLGCTMREETDALAGVVPLGLREILVLHDCFWYYDRSVAQVVGLLQRREERVPWLERAGVVTVGYRSGSDLGAREDLHVACRQAGIRYVDEPAAWWTGSA